MVFLNVDMSEINDLFDLKSVTDNVMQKAARDLTAATHARIVEIASQKLHSRRSMFLDGLSMFQMDENTFVINLDAKAKWIDEGMSEHSMLDALLRSPKAKHSKKDGHAYIVVPFQHNQGKQSMTPAQQNLLQTIKKELAKVDASPEGIEMDAGGQPKWGLVRSMDITNKPISTGALRIGRGPRGAVAQGITGTPLLSGISIYQKPVPDHSAAGSTKAARFVMTFRVATEKHRGEGRWFHPGTEATNIMQDGLTWALDRWNSKIAPGLIAKIVSQL